MTDVIPTPRLVLTPDELKRYRLSSVLAPVNRRAIENLRITSARYTRQNWMDSFGHSYKPLISTDMFQLGLYTHNGMFVVCFPHFMMVDFDTDDKRQAVKMLQKWTRSLEDATGEKLLWQVLETDGGIHAFLMSHPVEPTADDTVGAMLQLKSDKNYAAFTLFRGFCIRLNPKLYFYKPDPSGRNVRSREDVSRAMIARHCFERVCKVGNAAALPSLKHLLAFKMDMIDYLKRFTLEHYDYYDQNNTVVPSDAMIHDVVAKVRQLMHQYQLPDAGMYPMKGFVPVDRETDADAAEEDDLYITVGGVRGVSTFARYDQILAEVDYQACRAVTPGRLYHIRQALKNSIDRKAIHYIVSLTNMNKFVIGYDPIRRMAFIVLGDVFTADWDYSDTLQRDNVVNLVHQFLNNVQRMEARGRFRRNPLAFRMFETDNGMHAFCTSNTFPYPVQETQRLGISLCADSAYIAFVRMRGFSLRLTPKVTRRNKAPGEAPYVLDPTVSRTQFVQRPYAPAPVIAAPGAKENEGLVAVVNYVYDLQRHILALPNLYERMMMPDGTDPSLFKDIRRVALSLWSDVLFRGQYNNNDEVVRLHLQHGCTPATCEVVRHPKYKKVQVPLSHAIAVGGPYQEVRVNNKALWQWLQSRNYNELPRW